MQRVQPQKKAPDWLIHSTWLTVLWDIFMEFAVRFARIALTVTMMYSVALSLPSLKLSTLHPRLTFAMFLLQIFALEAGGQGLATLASQLEDSAKKDEGLLLQAVKVRRLSNELTALLVASLVWASIQNIFSIPDNTLSKIIELIFMIVRTYYTVRYSRMTHSNHDSISSNEEIEQLKLENERLKNERLERERLERERLERERLERERLEREKKEEILQIEAQTNKRRYSSGKTAYLQAPNTLNTADTADTVIESVEIPPRLKIYLESIQGAKRKTKVAAAFMLYLKVTNKKMSVFQISALLDISVGTVSGVYSLDIQKLKEILENDTPPGLEEN